MDAKEQKASGRRWRIGAWVAWTSWALLVALIGLRHGLELMTPGGDRAQVERWAGLLLPIAFPTVGAIVASRRPEHPVGWLFLVTAAGWSVADAAGAYAAYARQVDGASATGLALMEWLHGWPTYVSVGALVFLILLFPDGRLPSPRWRPVAWIAAAYTAAAISVVALAGIGGPAGQLLSWLSELAFPLSLMVFGVAAVSPLLRLRRARGPERQQLKWFTSAWVVVVVALAANVLLGLITPERAVAWRPYLTLALYISISLVPVSVGIAILKYRLYEIDLLINRALVYGGLTVCVVGLYVLVVGYLGALFQARETTVISLAATALVAVLFQPLRERLQSGVNRLLYGQRDEPYAALSRLGRRLETTLAPEAILPAIVETVREALKIPYAAITYGDGATGTVAATSGTPPTEDPLRLLLVHGSESVGELVLGQRGRGEAFSRADRRLLDDLARQAGVAVHAVRLTADLQRSNERLAAARERLVTAREEERRRLRRDLHDGLGPRLASLTLRLETARDRLARDPEAEALLADLAERTRETVADIRRVVYALRPAALDDLGLVSALREQAAQYGYEAGRDLRITVEAHEPLPALPAAVEVAAFRIVQEALTNVVRHAGARRCAIRLRVEDSPGALKVEVQDDGRGIDPTGRTGVGLGSMRERAEELGGTWSIERPAGGGTLVRAVLPCATSSRTGAAALSPSRHGP